MRKISNILKKRSKYLAPSLSLSYDEPLFIERGEGQYLFDHEGNKYLDAINNISHVGHCHPKVVEAAYQQSKLLNTNTRYLHESILDYASNLIDKLPDKLTTCFFTNSGSESNDLALRIARLYNNSKESIVMSGAYHGHTNSLIDISPYKFFGSGGAGKKDFVHVIPMPDEFAGEHLDAKSNFSDYYITVLKNKIDKIKKDGKKLAFFIIEPIMGCGGQVIIPTDFMKEAFVLVKEAGGLFIVDEVQIGFGRIGTHFWGFEMSSVQPDIVTLGKSIGNGHPLSAVITTKHIAETFNNGMEYFNSFGGNPVSCKIGQSVLDIIEDEGLQNNAQEAGKYLLNGLNLLQQKNSLIGDVRGRGLFIGVEIIKNNNKLSPDAIVADKIVNALRHKRVLISSDGPNHNVLKIKPPMVFNIQDADYLLESLEAVMKKIIR